MKTKIASLLLASAFSLAAFQAGAADKVTLQLKWVTQAQFGGYYVAKDKGFYEEEGLDVEIKPGGPDIAPAQVIAGGGADVIVDTIMAKTPVKRLPRAMALIAFVVGIPLFFEVGVVILIPVVMFAAKRAKLPVVLLGIPALAGLSALHGLVPPHPGPLIAIDAVGANLGLTLGFGLLVAIPCVIISGPLLGKLMAKWVPIPARDDFLGGGGPAADAKRPSFGAALTVVLLPVFLMLARTLVEMLGSEIGRAHV